MRLSDWRYFFAGAVWATLAILAGAPSTAAADDDVQTDGLVDLCLSHQGWSEQPNAQAICKCVDEESRGDAQARHMLIAGLTGGAGLADGSVAREIVQACVQGSA